MSQCVCYVEMNLNLGGKIRKMNNKRCICCGRNISLVHLGRKYCVSCGLFTIGLRNKISALKNDLNELRVRLYGQKRGSERVRYSK